MEVWKIIFLSKWVICRFQPSIFQGVTVLFLHSTTGDFFLPLKAAQEMAELNLLDASRRSLLGNLSAILLGNRSVKVKYFYSIWPEVSCF